MCASSNNYIFYRDNSSEGLKNIEYIGAVKKDLKLSDRIYKCDNCNTVIDRDKNASINLYNYGKSIA